MTSFSCQHSHTCLQVFMTVFFPLSFTWAHYCLIWLSFCFHRVSENHENKMSPSNLGIVFGPTLLRPLVSADMSMIAILETSYQSMLIEFLITHYDKIFGPKRTLSTPPPPAPTAPLPDTPPRASCPLDGEADGNLENVTSSKQRPRSAEVSTSVLKGWVTVVWCSFQAERAWPELSL